MKQNEKCEHVFDDVIGFGVHCVKCGIEMKEEKCEICATETKYVIHADFSKDGVKLDGTTILCDACYNEVD